QAKNTVAQHGKKSEATRQIVIWIFSAVLMTPRDWFLQRGSGVIAGSLGVDLETAVDVTLTSTEVQKIPSDAYGPLVTGSETVGGLLMGRSSAGIKGLIVIPGVIGADYTGQICIMAYTMCPPLFVPKGSGIAQILAFKNPLGRSGRSMNFRGDKGFGSTGPAVCFTMRLNQRPMEKICMTQGQHSVQLDAMLDSGADVTIVSVTNWPVNWEKDPLTTSIAGVGGSSVSYIS
ncbi:POK9 protein, partial [Oceanites oceanicus]|nr:POK9 protein [Oceanites oceanicus]